MMNYSGQVNLREGTMSRAGLFKSLRIALAVSGLAIVGVGCTAECVDLYDCRGKVTEKAPNWTCVDAKCVEGTPYPSDGGK